MLRSDPETERNKVSGNAASGVKFFLKDGLFYKLASDTGRERLYILYDIVADVFKSAYDLSNHASFDRVYDRVLFSFFIRYLSRRLRDYLKHYPDCQIYQTKRYFLYRSLNPITTLFIPFHTIVIDFVPRLPESGPEKFDILLIITCKFTKRILLVPEFIT